MIEKFKDKTPNVSESAFVHKMAYVQGDVVLNEKVSIWPGASVRADIDKILICENSNVQDNATVHVGHGYPVIIKENVTIGHNAIVHGATIEKNTIIGMGAIILDGAVVGEGCIIGAGAVIGPNKIIPDNSVVVGNPFKILRQTTEDDVVANKKNADEYYRLSSELKNN